MDYKDCLELCRRSQNEQGAVPPSIQNAVLDYLRGRKSDRKTSENLSEAEKEQCLGQLRELFSYIDEETISQAKGDDQITKLYYRNLKHGFPVITGAELRDHRYCLEDQQVLNLWGAGILKIHVLDIKDDIVRIEGKTQLSVIQRPYTIAAREERGNEHALELARISSEDIKGFAGECIAEMHRFKVEIPVHAGLRISMILKTDGQEVLLRPGFDSYIGLSAKYRNSFTVKSGYIIKYKGNSICFYPDNTKTRIASEFRLIRELKKKNDPALHEEILRIKTRNAANYGRLRDRVAFISVRGDEHLIGNMEKVYNALDLPKASFTKIKLQDYPELTLKAAKLMYSSRIVVTDDYLFLLRNYGKKEGQRIIQLWHATGSSKQFGQYIKREFPVVDNLYHRDYDVMTASSEGTRPFFSYAFGIPMEKVRAIGVARTDDFFDKEYAAKVSSRIYEKYPELKNKKVVLYTPTFRDVNDEGFDRSVFRPKLDFDRLSEMLPEDQVFVLRPHPVMTAQIIKGEYSNVMEIRDIPTNDLMFISDLMITDYSSTMYEYSLLRRPMAFFCYDHEEYDRDYYLDCEDNLPGPVLKTQEELFEYLRSDMHPLAEGFDQFYEKCLGACDGHSTERIVSLIKDMYNEKK